ncbi:MAG: glycosyltransferase family 2 protein [Chloroflexota bacterium]
MDHAGTGLVLTVIVVNWNTRELLRRCLLSLQLAPDAAGAQLVVVDNASSDGSAEMVRSQFPRVELIPSGANLGFAGGNNLALSRALGRYVLFLNPDTEVNPGAIGSMVHYLDDRPEVALVGTTLLNPDGSLQPSCHRYYGFWHTVRYNRLVDRLAGAGELSSVNRESRPGDVDWMTGACLLVRKSVLDQVGWFDPGFFVYGEEIDLQYRIKKAGWRVSYLPSCGVVHHGGQSARQAGLAASLHDYRGRWLFLRKHYPPFSVGVYLAKTVAALAVWMLFSGARAALLRSPDGWRQMRAYRQLLTWHLGERGLPPVPGPLRTLRGEESKP